MLRNAAKPLPAQTNPDSNELEGFRIVLLPSSSRLRSLLNLLILLGMGLGVILTSILLLLLLAPSLFLR